MKRKNVVLFDNEPKEFVEYLEGIQRGSESDWEPLCFRANEPQTSKLVKLWIYIKYFLFPLKVFFKRKQYNVIVGWQAFYAINFAFYCRLFHVKKVNTVLIQHLIYKPKNGFLGKIYEAYMRYSLNNEYVDIVQTEAEGYIDVLVSRLGIDRNKIHYIQFGVNDFSNWPESKREIPDDDFVLCIGRSNRDWDFVIDSLKNTDIPVVIICDTEDKKKETKNIRIYNNIGGTDTLAYFKKCRCSVTVVEDGALSSGDTVFCQQLCYGKPAVIVKPCSLSRNYLKDGYNGILVERDATELILAIRKMYNDEEFYKKLVNNCRKDFYEKYRLGIHSEKIGKLVRPYV